MAGAVKANQSKVVEVGDQNFENEVIKSKVPVVIDVWAPWCPPCRAYSPIFEETSKDYDPNDVKFVRINIDQNPKIEKVLTAMYIPATFLVSEGNVQTVKFGFMPKEKLKDWIKESRASPDKTSDLYQLWELFRKNQPD